MISGSIMWSLNYLLSGAFSLSPLPRVSYLSPPPRFFFIPSQAFLLYPLSPNGGEAKGEGEFSLFSASLNNCATSLVN